LCFFNWQVDIFGTRLTIGFRYKQTQKQGTNTEMLKPCNENIREKHCGKGFKANETDDKIFNALSYY
jgi:hypothetical protein